jgi:nicotinamide phosphoribosyltransferase
MNMFTNKNPILDTDSYKPGHCFMYPSDTKDTFFYFSSRGGLHEKTLFFGLQAIIKNSLMTKITHEHVDEMAAIFAWHGAPFNKEAWHRLVNKHGGKIPMRIRAVREGALVPVNMALFTVESTDPEFPWVPSYFETILMRAWYPTTVATNSWYIKQTIREALRVSSDDPEGGLPFKLHDFGSRGVSSMESAALGGMAHLVNFLGTDTVVALKAAKEFYSAVNPGFSIPASEHSTITVWGRENEVEAYRHMLRNFGKNGAIFACVSDSYDIYNAVSNLWGGELRQEVIDSGAILVVRPDSGEPVKVVTEVLHRLDEKFGSTINEKGYKVLNHVRVIQGDGVNPTSIAEILDAALKSGFSADNLAFGMGGALLQKVDRDTQKFALKCSAALRGDNWIDVYKDPVTDSGKRSLKGRITLVRNKETGEYKTVSINNTESGYVDVMHTIYENGELIKEWSFEEIKSRSNSPV